MAFTTISKLAVSASALAVGIALAGPASASVLVEPMILREGESSSDVTEVSESDQGSDQNIVEVASTTSDFSTLTAAVQTANIGSILSSEGPFTVFAPTDAAFAALPPGTLDVLLQPANRDLLVKLLYNHVGYGNITSDQLNAGTFETFDGTVPVAINPTGVTVGGATVVQADVDANNGVIHAVDQVLLPTGFNEQLQARITEGATAEVSSEASSTGSTSQISRTTELQETAIDRSATPAATTEPAATAQPEPQPEPAAQEPVRGLW